MRFHLIAHVSPKGWDMLIPHLKTAEPHHSFLTVEGLRTLVIQGHAKLVVAIEDEKIRGVCAVQILVYPSGKVMDIFMAGTTEAKAPFVESMLDFIRSLAQMEDCIGVSFTGRRGWRKWLRKMGLESMDCVYAWVTFNDAEQRKRTDGTANAAPTVPSITPTDAGGNAH